MLPVSVGRIRLGCALLGCAGWWAVPAAAWGAEPAPAAHVMAVLPVVVTGRAALMDAGPMLSAALAAKLQDLGQAKVITASEVQALLQAESERQAVGGGDDGALLEAAGALGAEQVVVGQIQDAGAQLMWSASLVRSVDSTTLQRAQVMGKSLGSLLARVDEMALGLLGRSEEGKLKGKKAMARLGLSNKEDLRSFREFREGHPESSVPEAFTEFIKTRNIESVRLAALEAGSFVGGGALLGGAAMTWLVALLVTSLMPLAPLGLVPLCLGPPLMAAGLGWWGVAVGAAIWDVLNRGQVAVRADGCCRDDDLLADEEGAREGPLRAAALAILLAGPALMVTAMGAVTMVSMVGLLYGIYASLGHATVATDNGYVTSPAYLGVSTLLQFWTPCAYLACCLPCLASPSGLLLLLLPSPPVLDKKSKPQAEEEL